MGSNFNLRNFGNMPPGGGGGGNTSGSGRGSGNLPLARQSSVYSLTLDEFQSSMGGSGRDFGSMNMDELLKSIWSAEESQTVGSASGGPEGIGGSGGYLQRQGSLTLPRTLSHKTVDEVWRDMSKEYGGAKGESAVGLSNIPQRQPTLGEMTLEEFLVRAGVVREDAQLAAKGNDIGIFGDFSSTVNNPGLGLGFGFQQVSRNAELMSGKNSGHRNNGAGFQSSNLTLNGNGVTSTQQQLGAKQIQQQPIFPKQHDLAYGSGMPVTSTGQLGNLASRGGIVGISETMKGNSVQSGVQPGVGIGIAGLGAGGVGVAAGSPTVSLDGFRKSGTDTSSVSPIPYVFNGGLRGRKSAALEKVVERRQRRMIKNRESAARSRARKQAYTVELEAEIAKLKEENEALQKKHAEMMEMQKNQVIEMMKQQNGAKRRCLRRTQTGPW